MKNQTNNNKEMLNKFKTEVASELGVDLNKENLTAREAGSVGGEMVRRMVKSYEDSHK
ncbi:MAG: alpha/beta-type small acid-soluble spore protein [Lachnospiraceae bacterium]|nr:alpha/beta-type small acid-soluble spore protein [Lachnospiraceae bacterium]